MDTIKVFRPKSIISICKYILAILLIVFTVSSGIYVFIESEDVRLTVFIAACVVYLLVIEIRLIVAHSYKKIVLDVDAIRVEKDKRGGFRILQHEINLPYADINSIEIVVSATDTNGEGQLGLFTPMPSIYMESDNAYKMINVYDYSKKQIIEMLDEIIKRAQAVGKLLNCLTGEEIIKQAIDKYSLIKKKKK